MLGGAVIHGVRSVLRDLRAGELRVLLVAVTISVAAMTAVAFFTDRVSQVVAIRSAEVLAADLVVRSNRPIGEDYGLRARELGVRRATATSFASVVVAGDVTALADIEAVSAGYPLRGQLRTADTPFAEPRVETAVPAGGEAWGDPKLLARLGIEVGTDVTVGSRTLRITRVLDYRPDQGWSFVDLAPTLLINEEDVEATGLVQPGSRVTYRHMFAGDQGAVDELRNYMEPRLGVSERIRDLRDAGPEIRSALDRAQRFLGLAALVGTLLAAIAVAMAAARYAGRQTDPVALMKAFGARQGYVLRLILAQLTTLAVIAGVAGVLVGFAAQQGLAFLLSDMAGGALPGPGSRPVVGGLLLSGLVLGGFRLSSLHGVCRRCGSCAGTWLRRSPRCCCSTGWRRPRSSGCSCGRPATRFSPGGWAPPSWCSCWCWHCALPSWSGWPRVFAGRRVPPGVTPSRVSLDGVGTASCRSSPSASGSWSSSC